MKTFIRAKSDQSKKLSFDKYHTPFEVAAQCIEIARNSVGPITEYLEPAAGQGAFSSQIPGCVAYDIAPETEGVIAQDYLSLEIPHKPGRMVIGNPPFGSRLNTAVLFYKKSVQIADFVAFILPLSQLENNKMFYEFDLVESVDIGKHQFSGQNVHCCFNVYERPSAGLNPRPASPRFAGKLKDITIKEVRVQNKVVTDYDIKICAWGSVGKIIEDGEHYAKELYIKVNRDDLRERVVDLVRNADWKKEYGMKGVCNLAQWHIIDYLHKHIEGLS